MPPCTSLTSEDPRMHGVPPGPGSVLGVAPCGPITHEEATRKFMELVAVPIQQPLMPAPTATRGRPRKPACSPPTATRHNHQHSCARRRFSPRARTTSCDRCTNSSSPREVWPSPRRVNLSSSGCISMRQSSTNRLALPRLLRCVPWLGWARPGRPCRQWHEVPLCMSSDEHVSPWKTTG